jgi:hypothetical protein
MEELYEELETAEGQKKLYSIAKVRSIASKHLRHIKQINDEYSVMLRRLVQGRSNILMAC